MRMTGNRFDAENHRMISRGITKEGKTQRKTEEVGRSVNNRGMTEEDNGKCG